MGNFLKKRKNNNYTNQTKKITIERRPALPEELIRSGRDFSKELIIEDLNTSQIYVSK